MSLNFDTDIDFYNFSYRCPYDFPWDFTKGLEDNHCEMNYFEAIMDKEGNLYQVPSGHGEGAIEMYLRDFGITRKEYYEVSDRYYYLEWLFDKTGYVYLRRDFIQGYLNDKHKETIGKLKAMGYISTNAYIDELIPYDELINQYKSLVKG